MLKSEAYLASLLPNFEEKRIIALIADTRKEYDTTIIPIYEKTVKAFAANSKDAKLSGPAFIEDIAKARLPRYKGDLVEALHSVLAKVPGKLDICEELVKEHFSTNVTKEGMTFAKANTLRFVEVLNFSGMYARRLLLALYASLGSKDVDIDDKMLRREFNWLEQNREGFFYSLSILDMRDQDLKSKFKNIPHLSMVEGQVKPAEDVIGKNKLDPVSLGFIPHRWNPIFHLRIAWENYLEGRRIAAHEEVRQLELYLLLNEDEKNLTPALKREITYSRERLVKARRKLEKMEEDVDDEEN